MHLSPCDLLLVEGFKHDPIPKLEIYRAAVGEPMLHPNDKNIVAVASDAPLRDTTANLPQLDLNDPAQIAAFILRHLGLEK
jgi:molybdopterin-guanine dinucleotide biosynthesis protein B